MSLGVPGLIAISFMNKKRLALSTQNTLVVVNIVD